MTKRVITLLVAILMVAALLAGCGEETTKTVTSSKAETVTGSYALFQTEDVQEYLNFLENFDETKYEIVDISTSMDSGYQESGEFYMVTFKTIAE